MFTMNPEQLEAFGQELHDLEQRTRKDLGARDVGYIKKVIRVQRGLEITGRALLFASGFAPPVVSGAKRPPKPQPLFAVDSTAPKKPIPTIASPVSLLYDQFSREGKQRRKMEQIESELRAEKARKARANYNKAFLDNRGYQP